MTPVPPDPLFLHSAAALISTGDELVLGQSLDTNSRALSQRLVDLGVPVVEHVTIGDDRAALAATLRRLAQQTPLVIVTGGLGPTLDDLTREALADVLGETLVEDTALLAELTDKLARRGRTVSEANRRQALRPPSARALTNPMGTAPGLCAMVNGRCDVLCLPGPPREWEAMWGMHVEPMLRVDPARAPRRALIHLVGLAESDAATRLGDLMDRSHSPTVGITAGGTGGVLTVRVRSTGLLKAEGLSPSVQNASASQRDEALDSVVRRVRELFGEHVFGEGEEGGDLAGSLMNRLKERHETLAVAESCTGGGLGRMITAPAGVSVSFQGGFITYSNELKKSLLGVPQEELDRHGAVSEPVARAMAEGAARAAGTTHALAVTGIAGPDGGTPGKPVGTVYIAHHDAGRRGDTTEVRRFCFPGTRSDVRERSAMTAMALLHFRLLSADKPPRLLWESEEPPPREPPKAV